MKINHQDYIGKTIFITATNTNVGKTFASEVFLKYFAKQGLKVGYFKPIETGVLNNSPLDGMKMFELVKKLNPNFLKLTINDIVPSGESSFNSGAVISRILFSIDPFAICGSE